MGKRANTTSESETLSEPPRTEVRGQRARNISFSDDDGLPSGMLTFCTQSEIIKFYIPVLGMVLSLKGKIFILFYCQKLFALTSRNLLRFCHVQHGMIWSCIVYTNLIYSGIIMPTNSQPNEPKYNHLFNIC